MIRNWLLIENFDDMEITFATKYFQNNEYLIRNQLVYNLNVNFHNFSFLEKGKNTHKTIQNILYLQAYLNTFPYRY